MMMGAGAMQRCGGKGLGDESTADVSSDQRPTTFFRASVAGWPALPWPPMSATAFSGLL